MGHFKIILIRLGSIYILWVLIINPRNLTLERKKKHFKNLANNSVFRNLFKTNYKYFQYFFSIREKINISFK